MEVEVKLRLPSSKAHEQIAHLLAPSLRATHLQENFFFDGSHAQLSSHLAILRLRFYNGDSKCVVSFKAKASLVDGISRVTEEEEDADVSHARACIAEPCRLPSLDCALIRKVVSDYNCNEFVCLGGFRNVRNVFDWQGLTLELDETQFDFGTCYEIECETTDPETVRPLLEKFLNENGIPFSYSSASKFAVFRSGRLPDV